LTRKCRSCGSHCSFLFSLGDLCVSNFPKDPNLGDRVPLDMWKCDRCHLVQLGETVDPAKLYSHFWYQSGISPSMRAELKDIVDSAIRENHGTGSIALDIGANDGTLLSFYPEDTVKVGFEPAINVAVKAQDIGHIFVHYFEPWRYQTLFHDKATIVTTIAMFYDLENPSLFTKGIAEVLAEDGLWANQMNYLPAMLEQNCYDHICHEHLGYYSLTTLQPLLEKNRLEAFRVEKNMVNGGSFRVYIAHKGQYRIQSSVDYFLKEEAGMALDKPATYRQFEERILQERHKLGQFIWDAMSKGKKIYVYGASTRGNTLLQYCGLNYPALTAAADANMEKWGRYTVGTKIPVISKTEASRERPDYYLILPYHFLPEIQNELKDFTAKGGHLIVPLPEFRII